MQALQAVELFAGLRPDGQPIVERLPVKELPDNTLQLVRSPGFVQGIASGDIIRLDNNSREFEIIQRSGNLSVRVYTKGEVEPLIEQLESPITQMGGDLDTETPRMLVYTIPVTAGFAAIEQLFNGVLDDNSTWQFGNVYDPRDGVTPLNWWQKPATDQG